MDFQNSNHYDSTETTDIENGFSSPLLIFAAVMTFIIMIVGIIGNFLTVAALIKCSKVRNVAAAFIISLCIADLLFCAFVLPFSAMRFVQGTWTHGVVLCKLIPFIQYGNIGVSLLCIGMITINRYFMIAHHSLYGKIYKRHWIAVMIAFCWIFSYGMQLPTLFGIWGTFDYDPKLGTCSIMSDKNGHSSKTALFITAFVIPCIIIIACYTKIFWVVRKSEQRLKKHANKQNSIPNNLRSTPMSSTENRISSNIGSDSSISVDIKQESLQKPSRIKDQREIRARRNEWRITKMVLAIFLSFVICYLPITIAKVADKDVEHPAFHIISYIMLYLSACINPIIYVIMNKQYRKAYKTVIMCEPSKLLSFGKTGGGGGCSSIAEKWKDIGLSNNHSRTMVSQMSVGGQPNTSLSSSQSHSIALQPTTTKKDLNENLNSLVSTPARIKLPQNEVQTETVVTSTNTISESPHPSQQTTNTELNHAALVDTNIIPEDTAKATPTHNNVTATEETEKIYMNMGSQTKNPFYGQNINVIPDNNTKLITKSKI